MDGRRTERKGGNILRKEEKQTPPKLFLHQCFIIFIHSTHKKSLSRLATTSKAMLSKSGAIVFSDGYSSSLTIQLVFCPGLSLPSPVHYHIIPQTQHL